MREKTREKEEKIPVLRVNGISDIHYEKHVDFETSIHRKAYKKACSITEEIIGETKNSEYVYSPREDHGRSDFRGSDFRNREQVCNILFFTGEKGTGKTSTMLSFMEYLKDYHRIIRRDRGMWETFSLGARQSSQPFLQHNPPQPYMFTGIEYIDASALTDKEDDILGNVLSKMVSKWKYEDERGKYQNSGIVKGIDYDYKKHQMYLQCAELFDRLKAVKSKENVMENDSDMFIESMESLSFSWNLKNSFQKLVQSYLDIMVYPDSGDEINRENHYLVISIDDIDMNVQYGFMLLEQIRKYLMVPNVLVLMSANYEQLEKICYNHYLKEFEEITKFDKNMGKGDNISYLRKISREYLEKMVPVQRRIELTSNRVWEFFSERKLQIRYGEDAEGSNGLNEKGTLSEIVSGRMYRCFGLRFAPDKKCIGYLAPDTVREICSWVCQIRQRNCFADGRCNDFSAFEDNLYWFFNIEFPRLCRKYLDAESCRNIRMLDILEPGGQIELVREILNRMLGRDNEKSLLKLFAAAKKGYEDAQDFGSLCLIYFGMKLQRMAVRMNLDPQGSSAEAGLLMKYYSVGGWGVFGNWEKNMLAPMAKWDRDKETKSQKFFGFCRIARTSFKKDDGWLTLDLEGMFTGGNKKSIIEFMGKNKEKLKNYQYLLLFYKLQETDAEQTNWVRNNGRLTLRQSRTGIFSLSGFVLNLIDQISLLKKFQNWFWTEVTKHTKFSPDEETSMRSDIFITPDIELLLPLQDVDFIVHLGTELQKKLGGAGPAFRAESVKLQVKRYFEVIGKCLEEYGGNYHDRFCGYELVKKILDLDRNFMTLLAKAIEEHTEPEDLPWVDDEWGGEDSNG